MAIFPLRNLSKYGVIADVDAYMLPTEAWSMAVNARFQNGYLERGPVFRDVAVLATASPRFVSVNEDASGLTATFVGYLNGTVATVSPSAETDVSPAGYVPASAETPYTACKLGDVFYVNRGDRIPWSLRTSDSQFQLLANWDATWQANILRSAGGALCAFGITKAGVSYPTMVKTSEFAIADTVPSTWDDTVATNNATENILAEMSGPITEAQALGEGMVVYGYNETWAMEADGSQNVWAYRKLFDGRGCINANCAIEIDRKHFVFGLNDLWVHDGLSPRSICDKRVRQFIFNSINLGNATAFHVIHNPQLNELYFCYASSDAYVGFAPASGCNRCAAYNLSEDTWTFYDLPYTYSAAQANVDLVNTWASLTSTWTNVGGTWVDTQSAIKRVVVMVGDDDTASGVARTLYAYDMLGQASAVSQPINSAASKPWMAWRDGIDLDEVGADLSGYKLCSSIYPQGRIDVGSDPIEFSVGSADYFSQEAVLSAPQTYDGNTLYRLDFNVSGRYLALKVTGSGSGYSRLTGIDFDMSSLGER